MPEILTLRVLRWPGNPGSYTVDDVEGSEIMSETAAPDFGLVELDEIGKEHGVTRWAEATDEDRSAFAASTYVLADHLVLVGWTDAPITRDDVQRSYHSGHENLPAVNIKVHVTSIADGEVFDELVDGEFAEELDPKLAALSRPELLALVDAYIEKHGDDVFAAACEVGFENAKDEAIETFFAGYSIQVWTAGRSGGWLVVQGLPDIEHWDAKLLKVWQDFSEFCEAEVSDIPRQMAWQVLANRQDELAGRVVRVELTFVLTDSDLEALGEDPATWDWHDMLDLSRESEVRARNLN